MKYKMIKDEQNFHHFLLFVATTSFQLPCFFLLLPENPHSQELTGTMGWSGVAFLDFKDFGDTHVFKACVEWGADRVQISAVQSCCSCQCQIAKRHGPHEAGKANNKVN